MQLTHQPRAGLPTTRLAAGSRAVRAPVQWRVQLHLAAASWVPEYGNPSTPGANADKFKKLMEQKSGNGDGDLRAQQRKGWWDYKAAGAGVGNPEGYQLGAVGSPQISPGGGGSGGSSGGSGGGGGNGGGGSGGSGGMKGVTYLFSLLLAAGGLAGYIRKGSTSSLFVTAAVVTLLLISASLMGHRSGLLLALGTTLTLACLMGWKASLAGQLKLSPASVVAVLSALMSIGYARALA